LRWLLSVRIYKTAPPHGIRADTDGFIYPRGYTSAMQSEYLRFEMDADDYAEYEVANEARREMEVD
jgi:nanoRNase/pAp phosphatase (c-di-AMP/oligoRNAs hydrolase)